MLFFNVALYFSKTDVSSMYDIKLNKNLFNLESWILLIFLLVFICSPACNFILVQKYSYNDNQIIEWYAVYIITYILCKPNCREMC